MGYPFYQPYFQKNKKFHDFLNWEFQLSGWFQEIPNGGFRQSARMGKWKAVRYNLDSDIEVYNIENDKGETEDLAKMYPDVVKRAEIVFKHARSDVKGFPYGGVKQNYKSMNKIAK